MLGVIAQRAFPAGVVNIISGGDQLGRWIVEHPDVSHISFTGSERTGKAIMASASATLKKLTLELGGKSCPIFSLKLSFTMHHPFFDCITPRGHAMSLTISNCLFPVGRLRFIVVRV